jgi:DNA topoisomerase-1
MKAASFGQSVEAKPASAQPICAVHDLDLAARASRKFGMGARQCMSAAQRLYEAGHITYMRTDGIDMAPEAVPWPAHAIADRFGDRIRAPKPAHLQNKAKNAQEAHECIRPTRHERRRRC